MIAVTNNGSRPFGRGPSPYRDAHGQAALLLTESLMHALVANGTISREVFIEVVEGVTDVERELASESATPPEAQDGSLLSPLARAFRQELGR